LYPYILQSMGRALYSAGRFDEAYIVFRWIQPTFSKFQQVQFEKMWAAFRGGRVDHALGAIASQKSEYFSKHISPESYLVQIYLYKKLCREDDYKQVLNQVRSFRKDVQSGAYSRDEWLKSEVENRILYNLIQMKPEKGLAFVSAAERKQEQERLHKILDAAFKSQRSRLLDEIDKVLAYVQLTIKSGGDSVLKPLEILPDRSSFFKLNLEIWPADSAEEWIDEVGTHRFVGESLCGKRR